MRATRIGGSSGRKPGCNPPFLSNIGHTDQSTEHKDGTAQEIADPTMAIPATVTMDTETMGRRETVVGRATMALAAPDCGHSLRRQSSR